MIRFRVIDAFVDSLDLTELKFSKVAADRTEAGSANKAVDIAAALEALKAQKQRLQAQAQDLAARGLKQEVMTEPEARLMRTPRGHAVA